MGNDQSISNQNLQRSAQQLNDRITLAMDNNRALGERLTAVTVPGASAARLGHYQQLVADYSTQRGVADAIQREANRVAEKATSPGESNSRVTEFKSQYQRRLDALREAADRGYDLSRFQMSVHGWYDQLQKVNDRLAQLRQSLGGDHVKPLTPARGEFLKHLASGFKKQIQAAKTLAEEVRKDPTLEQLKESDRFSERIKQFEFLYQ
jgi:hypothetical protein